MGEYYLSFNVDELMTDVVRHYTDTVWSLVLDSVAAHSEKESADRLVLERSALLPELVATLENDNVGAVWLTGSDQLSEQLIYASSEYEAKSEREQKMSDSFLSRTRRYDADSRAALKRLGLPCPDVGQTANLEDMMDTCLTALVMSIATASASAHEDDG